MYTSESQMSEFTFFFFPTIKYSASPAEEKKMHLQIEAQLEMSRGQVLHVEAEEIKAAPPPFHWSLSRCQHWLLDKRQNDSEI